MSVLGYAADGGRRIHGFLVSGADQNRCRAQRDKQSKASSAGVKYLRFLHDQYFADLPLDRRNRHLFAFAAYNAGPARIRKLRATARSRAR